jgi:molecular chaperone GrpE (heat shock protein)
MRKRKNRPEDAVPQPQVVTANATEDGSLPSSGDGTEELANLQPPETPVEGQNVDAPVISEPMVEGEITSSETQQGAAVEPGEVMEPEEPTDPSSAILELSAEDKAMLQSLSDAMQSMRESTEKISAEVREMHKLYHNEYSGRLRNVQSELDQYHERDRGRTFDGILGEIAKLYSENESVVDRVDEPKTQKQLQYMFLDMLQILESYGVARQKSDVGDKRNPRYCQVVERVTTNDPEKHDTIVQSRNTGFYIENRPIVKERVDVYIFSADKPEAAEVSEIATESTMSDANVSEA